MFSVVYSKTVRNTPHSQNTPLHNHSLLPQYVEEKLNVGCMGAHPLRSNRQG